MACSIRAVSRRADRCSVLPGGDSCRVRFLKAWVISWRGVVAPLSSHGWRPHSDQIGQTGLRIAPDLYIACGISGAIQHIVGCKAAKRILAINTDAEAPIMGVADYAVIGDLHQIVPAITAEIRRRANAPA